MRQVVGGVVAAAQDQAVEEVADADPLPRAQAEQRLAVDRVGRARRARSCRAAAPASPRRRSSASWCWRSAAARRPAWEARTSPVRASIRSRPAPSSCGSRLRRGLRPAAAPPRRRRGSDQAGQRREQQQGAAAAAAHLQLQRLARRSGSAGRLRGSARGSRRPGPRSCGRSRSGCRRSRPCRSWPSSGASSAFCVLAACPGAPFVEESPLERAAETTTTTTTHRARPGRGRRRSGRRRWMRFFIGLGGRIGRSALIV